jgi:hypothetical protein
VGCAGAGVDCEGFEGFVVWFEGVDGELAHHGVVAGDHLEVGQVAEAVGFVDCADGLDGVVGWVVFEVADEVGCCYAAVAVVLGIIGMVSEWFI